MTICQLHYQNQYHDILSESKGLTDIPTVLLLGTTRSLPDFDMAANVPAGLKAADISRFAMRAAQVETVKPVIAYWCKLYRSSGLARPDQVIGNYWIVNQILSKNQYTADTESKRYATTLMDKLEQVYLTIQRGLQRVLMFSSDQGREPWQRRHHRRHSWASLCRAIWPGDISTGRQRHASKQGLKVYISHRLAKANLMIAQANRRHIPSCGHVL